MLWQEYIASKYAIDRIYKTEGPEAQYDAYRVLAPAFGSYVSLAALTYLVKYNIDIWGKADSKRSKEIGEFLVQLTKEEKWREFARQTFGKQTPKRIAVVVGSLVLGHAIGRIVGHIQANKKSEELKRLKNEWNEKNLSN